jgi:hemerythrin-like metal-binding protein
MRRTPEPALRRRRHPNAATQEAPPSRPWTSALLLRRAVWDPSCSSGHAELDEGHLALFSGLQSILRRIGDGHPKSELAGALDALLRECREHFGDEERLLWTVGYPDSGPHVEMHRALITRFEQVRDNFVNPAGASQDLSLERLHDLVVSHVVNEDRKFFPWLNLPAETAGSR